MSGGVFILVRQRRDTHAVNIIGAFSSLKNAQLAAMDDCESDLTWRTPPATNDGVMLGMIKAEIAERLYVIENRILDEIDEGELDTP